MASERNKELASELLTAKGFTRSFADADVPEKFAEAHRAFRTRYFELLVELYAELYDENQLAAELNFYESDIGKSIIRAQEEIQAELKRRAPEAFRDLEQQFYDGTGKGIIGSFSRKWPPTDEG
jgi:hypothetical protein